MADEIKIRTIPRSNEKPAIVAAPAAKAPPARSTARIAISIVLAAILLLVGLWNATRNKHEIKAAEAKSAPTVDRVSASITRHIYDTHLMEQMMKRKQQIENQAAIPKKGAPDYTMLPDKHSYGVQMDQENTAERLYEELNGSKAAYGDNIDEKINASLANRKWLNELERAERINFVRNFIRQAYDRGYEVQLDHNLIVVGVRRITNKSVNIDQVLDRLAKQGH